MIPDYYNSTMKEGTISNKYKSFKDLRLGDFSLYTNSTSILPYQISGILLETFREGNRYNIYSYTNT